MSACHLWMCTWERACRLMKPHSPNMVHLLDLRFRTLGALHVSGDEARLLFQDSGERSFEEEQALKQKKPSAQLELRP